MQHLRSSVLGVGVSVGSGSTQSGLLGRRATSEGGTLAQPRVAATSDGEVTGNSGGVCLGIGVDVLNLVGGVYDLEEVVGLNGVFTLSRGGEVVSGGN